MDSAVAENETILGEALRTYEESSRSLKSICQSVEKENEDFQQEIQHLQIHQKNLFEQFDLIQRNIQFLQQDFHSLQQKQFLLDQQYSTFHQRYEQIQSALKIILSSTDQPTLSSSHIFSHLGLKISPIEHEDKTSKRKQRSDHFSDKSPKKFSSRN